LAYISLGIRRGRKKEGDHDVLTHLLSFLRSIYDWSFRYFYCYGDILDSHFLAGLRKFGRAKTPGIRYVLLLTDDRRGPGVALPFP